MRHLKALFAAFVLINLVLLALAPTVHADLNDFTVTSFKADYTLTKADPQGQLNVSEAINVDFTDQNHGILRAIPDSYKGHSLELKVDSITSTSGAPTEYSTYQSGGNTVLKIGDPTRTVTGAQEYTINYTLNNVISFYQDHDELYWDINGNQWTQAFENVTATLHLPRGLQLNSQAPVCYAGATGSTTQGSCVGSAGWVTFHGRQACSVA